MTRIRVENVEGHVIEVAFVYMPEGRVGPNVSLRPGESREFHVYRGMQLRVTQPVDDSMGTPAIDKPRLDAVLA